MNGRVAGGCVALSAILLVSCSGGGDGAPSARATPPARSQMDALLQQYPPCTEPSPGREVSKVRGLLLPQKTIVYSVRRQGPITTVQGFVPMNPVQVREYYEKDPDIQIIVSEDEFVESELLFSNGNVRNFVKARASCREGSDIVTVIARELTALPAPAGTAGEDSSPDPSAPATPAP
jgi:hypothetical protein